MVSKDGGWDTRLCVERNANIEVQDQEMIIVRKLEKRLAYETNIGENFVHLLYLLSSFTLAYCVARKKKKKKKSQVTCMGN